MALAAGGPAAALGFGDIRAQVLLGQPLNLAVPVSLAEGETLSADCASAEVTAGDARLPPGSVRVRVTQGRDASEAVVRIVSSTVIDEPVVNVTVSAGCPPRITRTLVLLADPPLVAPTTTAAAAPAPVAPASADPTPSSRVQAPSGNAAANPAATTPPARATRPAAPPRAARQAAARAAEAPPRQATVAAAPRAPRAEAAAAAPRPAERPSGRPRLQLDAAQVTVNQEALKAAETQVAAAEAQASAARLAAVTAEAAASSAQQRLQAMETEVARMRAEAKAQTDALVALRQQIAQDQSQRQQQGWLNPLLLGLAVLLALVAVWVAARSRRQSPPPPQREAWWDKGGASVPAAFEPEEDSNFAPSRFKTSGRTPLKIPSAPAPLGAAAREGPPTDIGLDSLIAPPTVAAPVAVTIPPVAPRPDESSRAVSVDEQIDLEQQADFFIALGHDESAIDLLMAHLRSTGGGTPLPFLKLLEIHRRRGDNEAYERTRVRFNQRFNSVAPEWGSDPGAGRTLEDYPLVVGRIQHAWPRPLDAMAELEALLFRRGAGSEMFELPAYQEVLFLYQLARDLHQADQPEDAENVDVLLPIGAAAAPVAEGTIVLRPEFNGGQAVSLDLDLSTKTGAAFDTSHSSGVELDLGQGDGDKPAPRGDIWSEDPDERRRK